MQLRHTVVLVVLATAAWATADAPQSVQTLAARAEAAHPEDRPGLFIEIADRQLKFADQSYSAGKVDDARAAISDVATYSEKAHDAAIQSGKKLKNTEIAVRKMAEKLRDIKRTLNFEDQAPVQSAADRLEKLRTDLLSHMFGKGGK